MTDEQFIYELTKPVSNDCFLSFLEYDERIKKLSLEPQFKAWIMKHTEAGCSHDDEWFLYEGESELEKELGSRISWLAGLSNSQPIDITSAGDFFPMQAQSFEYEGYTFWLLTCWGQGAISWIMTDKLFQQEYGDRLEEE